VTRPSYFVILAPVELLTEQFRLANNRNLSVIEEREPAMLRFTRALFVLLIALSLAACGGISERAASNESAPTFAPVEPEGNTSDTTSDVVNQIGVTPRPTTTPAPTSVAIDIEAVSMSATPLAMMFADVTELPPAAGGGDGGGESVAALVTPVPDSALVSDTVDSSAPASVNVVASPLNAGEIDDNALWNDYLLYRREFLSWGDNYVRDVDINDRHIITVTNAQDLPILGARVLIYNEQTLITESRTYSSGQTLFFPSAWAAAFGVETFRVVVQTGNRAYEFTLDPQRGSNWHVELDLAPAQTTPQLDILFLLDATGSMGDEIAQLQNNIMSISTQVNQTLGNTDVRYGLVAYRDHGDDYVTRTYDFVPDVQTFQEQLNRVRADGGGDTPEALNEGLHAAIREVSWRGEDTIKLVFLVADAAPHLDYTNDYDYSHEMVAAAWQGIKIYPIASSGLTPDGEYVFRQMAQYTMGNFIFLTYASGTSGPSGETRTDLEAGEEMQQQQNYSVEQLDELVVQRITDEINALNIPVDVRGVSPSLTLAPTLAENRIPNTFNLLATLREPVSVAVTQMEEIPPTSEPTFRLSMTQIVGIVFVCLLIGYSISMIYRAEKRKRKNEEVFNAVKQETERIEQTP
jgi:uncharacterized protein YegL